MEGYLNPPAGQPFTYPTDIEYGDLAYTRMYLKWKYADELEPSHIATMSYAEMLEFLTAKGYTFGLPLYNDDSNPNANASHAPARN